MAEQLGALAGDGIPDTQVKVRDVFGLDTDMEVPAFSTPSSHVPLLDESYLFNHETTIAILASFAHNRRCMIQGYHGTGKSTHIEQVAARLNWPCIRINLDSHVSRMDLIGKDAIVLLRVSLPSDSGLYPEISGGHHRFTLRFMEWSAADSRPVQAEREIQFLLATC